MSDTLYVATDSDGVEHTEVRHIQWAMPTDTGPRITDTGHLLYLRPAGALLDVLDDCIHRVEPLGEGPTAEDGTRTVESARILSTTGWDTEMAARFAVQCAAHMLGPAGDAHLPDGRKLADVLADAEALLDGSSEQSVHNLGHLARLRALRRLRKEGDDISHLLLQMNIANAENDIHSFDDPAYASALPLADAVLAAIEALRHRSLPHEYTKYESEKLEEEDREDLDRKTEMPTPHITNWGIGTFLTGGEHKVMRYQPAATAARETARHARHAMQLRGGDAAEAEELAWQAEALESLLG